MTTVQFPNQDLIAKQAAAWVAMIDRGLSNEEEQRLNSWLAASPLHGEALVQLATTWDLLDILRPIAKILPIDSIEPAELAATTDSPNPPAVRVSHVQEVAGRPGFRPLAIAATLALFAVTALFSLPLLNIDRSIESHLTAESEAEPEIAAVDVQEFVTAVGEQSNITLADGSQIKLNTDTVVSVRFTAAERNIELHRGEAYFDVAKNPQRPFVVHTSSSRVTAVGTAFSVDVSNIDDTEVLVAEGRVKVDRLLQNDLDLNRNGGFIIPSSTPVFLSQGQKVSLNQDNAEVSDNEDIDSALAWREGMIIFTGQSLEQAIEEIDRYIPLEFKITDPKIATIPVGGFFKTGDLDQLLIILKDNFGVQSERQGNSILLSKAN
ncbi:MAG: FecR domain-containing protein [Pseudomonadota bacterium]